MNKSIKFVIQTYYIETKKAIFKCMNIALCEKIYDKIYYILNRSAGLFSI
jgi:hypothetical protein